MKLFTKPSASYLDWEVYVDRVIARDTILFMHHTTRQSLKHLIQKERRTRP